MAIMRRALQSLCTAEGRQRLKGDPEAARALQLLGWGSLAGACAGAMFGLTGEWGQGRKGGRALQVLGWVFLACAAAGTVLGLTVVCMGRVGSELGHCMLPAWLGLSGR